MLELRPTCENCNKPLPPDAMEARICSYECTFCAACVDGILGNVCRTAAVGSNRDRSGRRRTGRATTTWEEPGGHAYQASAIDPGQHAQFATAIRDISPAPALICSRSDWLCALPGTRMRELPVRSDNSNVAHPAQDDTSGKMPELTVRPLTTDRWADLELLLRSPRMRRGASLLVHLLPSHRPRMGPFRRPRPRRRQPGCAQGARWFPVSRPASSRTGARHRLAGCRWVRARNSRDCSVPR